MGVLNYGVANQSDAAFRWTEAEGLTTLGVLPGYDSSHANDVSDDGIIIVGQSFNRDCGQNVGCDMDGFTWTEADGMTKIDSYGTLTRPLAISGDGTAAVGFARLNDETLENEAILWTKENGTVGLGHLPGRGDSSFALAVSFDGSVVLGESGRWGNGNQGDVKAFVWDNLHGMRDLQEVLQTEHGINDLPRNALESAWGISNDQMTIVGRTRHQFGGVWLGQTAWAIYLDKPLVSPWGDLNDDHYRDAADVDLLSQQIRASSMDVVLDLNKDGSVDAKDRIYWVHEMASTYFGDANLDGEFNSSDLVAVFEAGQYEDEAAGNSGWATGDWNGDAEFNTSDLVAAFQDGGYEQGPRAAARVIPEPSSSLAFTIAALIFVFRFHASKVAQVCNRAV